MSRWESWAPTAGAGHADPLVDRLLALVGKGRVFVLSRAEGRGAPRCLVQPDTTEATAATVRALRESGVPLHVVQTPPPFDPPDAPAGAVYLDLGRLTAVLAVDETNQSVSVQAGITWGRLEDLMMRRGSTLGPVPVWLRNVAIAESVARNDRLRPSARYGQLLDAVLAVTAVLPTGAIARTTVSPRRATGPELPAALLGTRHRNGVLCEVQLQIWRRSGERPRASFTLPDWGAAEAFMRQALQAGVRPALGVARGGVNGTGPVGLSLELASAAEAVVLERLLKAAAVTPRARHEALDAALASVEAGAVVPAPFIAGLVPPALLPGATALLPATNIWDLGGPWLSLWVDAPTDELTQHRLAELGVRVPARLTGFEALGDAVTRALRNEG